MPELGASFTLHEQPQGAPPVAEVTLAGPEGSPYQGNVFKFQLTLIKYPYALPRIKVLTSDVLHPMVVNGEMRLIDDRSS